MPLPLSQQPIIHRFSFSIIIKVAYADRALAAQANDAGHLILAGSNTYGIYAGIPA
jgi:hypothetical protein